MLSSVLIGYSALKCKANSTAVVIAQRLRHMTGILWHNAGAIPQLPKEGILPIQLLSHRHCDQYLGSSQLRLSEMSVYLMYAFVSIPKSGLYCRSVAAISLLNVQICMGMDGA